ncbi:hypothetical protein KOR34_44300 [Posidoniimonas corsicana]|uniref:Uncharacterized protein n=1 Tax=Posidoniimonas corsicana TaxID=1938618 RepID=A0A5C5UXH2_9BACT|nr:hypothetical protein [Posidoniimonas corsicana]TWT31056.1 hypothetical protein KOR34_44300 [Posidoniimonas corsicana]
MKNSDQPTQGGQHRRVAGPQPESNRTGTRILGGLLFSGVAVMLLFGGLSLLFGPLVKMVAIAWPMVFLLPSLFATVLVVAVTVAVAGGVLGSVVSPGLVDAAASRRSPQPDEQPPPWRLIGVAYKGQHISIDGVAPWGRAWRPWESEPTVVLPNPKYRQQTCEYQVFQLGVKDRNIVFAAAELSPSEYAFYLRTARN